MPEDGPRGPKHVVNKHRLNCADCVFDYLHYKREHNGMPTLKFVMSVCPSVGPPVYIEQLGFHWTDFD